MSPLTFFNVFSSMVLADSVSEDSGNFGMSLAVIVAELTSDRDFLLVVFVIIISYIDNASTYTSWSIFFTC